MKPDFFTSSLCAGSAHCGTCRNRESGRNFRSQVAAKFETSGIDFDCAHGKDWGYVAPAMPLVQIGVKAAPMRKREPPKAIPRDQWPAKIKRLATKAIATDRGIGDVLERRYARFGGRVYKKLRKKLGVPCSCDAKQETMNLMYPLPSRQ